MCEAGLVTHSKHVVFDTRCAHVRDPHVTLQISILEALTLFGVEAVRFHIYLY